MTPEFSKSIINGYNRREVDEYIIKLRNECTEVCKHLQEKIQEMEATLKSQEDISNTMIFAQTLSRKLEAEANVKADQVLIEANVKAEKVINEADIRAERTVNEAQIKALKITSVATVKADDIVERAKQQLIEVQEKMVQIYNISSIFMKEMETRKEEKSTPSNDDDNSFENGSGKVKEITGKSKEPSDSSFIIQKSREA